MFHSSYSESEVLSPPTTVCLPCANVSCQSTHGVTCAYVYVYVCFRAACGEEGVSDGWVHFRIILCCQRTSVWQCQRPLGKEQVESAESWRCGSRHILNTWMLGQLPEVSPAYGREDVGANTAQVKSMFNINQSIYVCIQSDGISSV